MHLIGIYSHLQCIYSVFTVRLQCIYIDSSVFTVYIYCVLTVHLGWPGGLGGGGWSQVRISRGPVGFWHGYHWESPPQEYGWLWGCGRWIRSRRDENAEKGCNEYLLT